MGLLGKEIDKVSDQGDTTEQISFSDFFHDAIPDLHSYNNLQVHQKYKLGIPLDNQSAVLNPDKITAGLKYCPNLILMWPLCSSFTPGLHQVVAVAVAVVAHW